MKNEQAFPVPVTARKPLPPEVTQLGPEVTQLGLHPEQQKQSSCTCTKEIVKKSETSICQIKQQGKYSVN